MLKDITETTEEIFDGSLTGLYGWLIIFQIRLYAYIIQVLPIIFDLLFPMWLRVSFMVVLTMFALCLILFYKRNIIFRLMYICAIVSNVFVLITAENTFTHPDVWMLMISLTFVEVFFIIALFHSQRVKNAFK